MRILIIGAGVTGSLYASFLINAKKKLEKRLKEPVEIKILARGETFRKINDNGLKIQHHIQNIITIDQIPVIKTLDNKDTYDYILIFLRKTQIKDLLPDLASNNSRNFAFVGNNGFGADEIKKTIPISKIILGFPGVGGVKKDGLICSVHKNKPHITLGSANSRPLKPVKKLIGIMKMSGIGAVSSNNMDSWLKYHIALVSPLANAIYYDGGDNFSLSQNDIVLKMAVKAIREGFQSLRSLKYPVKPFRIMVMMLLPNYLIRIKLKKLLSSEIGKLIVDDHCKAAPEEMKALAEDFQQIIGNSHTERENLQTLFKQFV